MAAPAASLRSCLSSLLPAAILLCASPAAAQDSSLFSPETLSALVDLRGAVAGGERASAAIPRRSSRR